MIERDEAKQNIVNEILYGELAWAFDYEVLDGEFSSMKLKDSAEEVAEKILQMLYD